MRTNLKFRGSTLNVIADDQEKAKNLLQRFEKRAEKFATNNGNITDFKLALISAIMLEEEFDSALKEVECLKKKLLETQKEKKHNHQHDEENLLEIMNFTSSYLEDIANKFQK